MRPPVWLTDWRQGQGPSSTVNQAALRQSEVFCRGFAALVFGRRPKTCRPAADEASRHTQEKISCTQGTVDKGSPRMYKNRYVFFFTDNFSLLRCSLMRSWMKGVVLPMYCWLQLWVSLFAKRKVFLIPTSRSVITERNEIFPCSNFCYFSSDSQKWNQTNKQANAK